VDVLQYRERIIFLGQYIDEEFGNQIVATMLYLDSVDSTLSLSTPGFKVIACAIVAVKSSNGILNL
jgi:ATP-dependent Clp protease protease subunit